MRPVRIMHGSVRDALLGAVNSSQHHVGRINRMHEVGRESRILLRLVNGLVIYRVGNGQALQNSGDNIFISDRFIRLNTR
jgi:hypothetical protein